ncbi:MAG TPA: ABC transporter permease [Candidatus Scatomonas pullistercoris]|uniref:Autoinducer 2 import system permease protein LsrD n=1 Tax=Candidatus Scatomonas pullistercoris TaxID=2840920 RepID=A0A9D1P452_9FIRM|nr:ABC transporter permease [Candidatus Scatomonas pullistercoris]
MQSSSKKKSRFDISKYVVYIIFVLCIAIFGIWLGDSFFSVTNLLNVVRQSGAIAVMAIGMVFIIGLGHIDLSISSVVAVSALLIGVILRSTGNIFLAMLAALGFGALVGLCNGLCVTRLHMPAFLTTLGVQSILTGIAMWMTGTKAVPITNDTFLYWFGSGQVGGVIPILLFWAVAAMIIGHIVLSYTSYGRRVLASGGNVTAARYAGVNVKRVTVTAFMMQGILAALAGALYAGRTQAARWDFGEGVEMNVIAAVVLGGTAMSGGTGSAIGAVVGSVLIMMINNGLVIGRLGVAQQTLMQGVIIIIAVALSELGKKRRE